jgi:hypothetical protein
MNDEFIPLRVISFPVIPAKAGIQIPGLSGRSRTMTIGGNEIAAPSLQDGSQ